MRKSSLRHGVKTAVLVKDGEGYSNETIDSINPDYLLWATACFLEDHLPKSLTSRIQKQYYKNI